MGPHFGTPFGDHLGGVEDVVVVVLGGLLLHIYPLRIGVYRYHMYIGYPMGPKGSQGVPRNFKRS